MKVRQPSLIVEEVEGSALCRGGYLEFGKLSHAEEGMSTHKVEKPAPEWVQRAVRMRRRVHCYSCKTDNA
jgi:hypothetical protein